MRGRFRGKRRRRPATRRLAACSGLRHSAQVATRRLRTANYDQTARERLADAVNKARTAMGYKFRPAFAEFAGVSARSFADLETAKPTVGEANLKAVGRAIPTWTEDTPREILEGGPIPPLPDPAEIREPVKDFQVEDGVTFTVTKQDQERWRRMTRDEIAEEGAMLGRTIGLRAQQAYLRAAIDARESTVDVNDE